jgi:uncharacterized protein (DUF433 family)
LLSYTRGTIEQIGTVSMKQLSRIRFNPEVMGGKPCIRGLRVTVGLMALGRTPEEILEAYPYLDRLDIYEALTYAVWRVEEQ